MSRSLGLLSPLLLYHDRVKRFCILAQVSLRDLACPAMLEWLLPAELVWVVENASVSRPSVIVVGSLLCTCGRGSPMWSLLRGCSQAIQRFSVL